MLFRRPITSEALGGGLCSHANHLTRQCKGKCIVVGGPDGRWISPLVRGINAVVLSRLVSQYMVGLLARLNKEDLTIMRDPMEVAKVTPVIDRRCRLSEVPEAIRYLEEGHGGGKVVITLEHNNET